MNGKTNSFWDLLSLKGEEKVILLFQGVWLQKEGLEKDG